MKIFSDDIFTPFQKQAKNNSVDMINCQFDNEIDQKMNWSEGRNYKVDMHMHAHTHTPD